MIQLHNINFSYGNCTIFKDLNLSFGEKGTTCIFGGSGSGKTTLLKLIMGLLPPDSGRILGTQNLRFSAVFQEDRLLPFASVLSNLTLVTKRKEGEHKSMVLLNQLGLLGVAHSHPSSLSGGMKRRVAIARALLAEFDVLILDEPFAGLDHTTKQVVARCMLKEAGNRPIIMVSHSKEEAELMGATTIHLPSYH